MVGANRSFQMTSGLGALLTLVALFAGCVKPVEQPMSKTTDAGGSTSGSTSESTSGSMADAPANTGESTKIAIDGSSTVFPISQAVSEEFKKSHPNVDITVGFSGTGGGFKEFVKNRLDICDASRPIKDAEKAECEKNEIEYLELEIALDGLSVVVNKDNDWLDCISISDLKKMWEPNSKITKWNEVNPAWPDEKIELFGADTDSGTFEYFTEVVNGKSKASRTEYTPAANDNVLVQGVAAEKFALGYFGYGYYVENASRLKVLSIKATDDAECIAPTPETIRGGTYKPMSRPLFIYINKASLKRPEVLEFARFYLSEAGQKLVSDVKFVQMPEEALKAAQAKLEAAIADK